MEVEAKGGAKGARKHSESDKGDEEVGSKVTKAQKLNNNEAKKITKEPEQGLLNKKQKAKKQESDSSEEEIVVPPKKGAPAAAAKKGVAGKKAAESSDTSSEDSEIRTAKAKAQVKAVGGKAAPAGAKKAEKMEVESSDSDAPTTKKAGKGAPVKPILKQAAKGKKESSDESDDSTPKAGKKAAATTGKPKVGLAHAAKNEDSSEESSDAPPAKGAKGKPVAAKVDPKKAAPAKGKKAESSEESSEEEKPKGKAQPAAKGKAPVKKADSDSEEASEEEKAPAKGKAPAKAQHTEEDTPTKSHENGNNPDAVYEIIVKGLAYAASEHDLKELFAEAGNVTNVNLLKDQDGNSKGIAFVKFDTEAGQTAGTELNGTEHMGRELFVEKARGKQDRPPRQGGAGYDRPKSEKDPNSTTVFVGGLAYSSTDDSVSQFFSSCGGVNAVRIAMDQEGNPRGFAHVEFTSTDSVDKAIAKTGQKLDGRPIRVDYSGNKKEGGGDRGGRDFSRGRGGGRGGGGRGGFRGGSRGGFNEDRARNKGTGIGDFAGQKIRF